MSPARKIRRSRWALTTAGIAVSVAFFLSTAAVADDWPQWRGPDRNGRSPDTGLLQEWPTDGPPLDWRVSGLGSGFSSVAVAGERIYTMGDLGDAPLR